MPLKQIQRVGWLGINSHGYGHRRINPHFHSLLQHGHKRSQYIHTRVCARLPLLACSFSRGHVEDLSARLGKPGIHYINLKYQRRGTVSVSNGVAEDDVFLQNMLNGLLKRDRAWLSRAITLVESTKPEHRVQAQDLISSALQIHNSKKKVKRTAFRIGLSGPPGAGKSTFIESFGNFLIEKGFKIAVLAVDPSSTRTGGSILGDKTRMEKLSKDPNAYIRPSPSRCTLGGVARNTTEAIALCEVAGYDIIIVETVGVGQSETNVADMVDLFCLLMPPAAGDELQGIKRGIVEIAQLVLVNKADGDLMPAAMRAAAEIKSALKILRPQSRNWKPKVRMLSSYTKDGIDKAWDTMCDFRSKMLESGEFNYRRRSQNQVHMWSYVQANTMELLHSDPDVKNILKDIEKQVMMGEKPAGAAADEIVNVFLRRIK